MADIKNDSRIVLTLDAGGTNMVFGAMKGGEYYGNTITLPSNASNLDLCLQAMVLGFATIIERLGSEKPVARFSPQLPFIQGWCGTRTFPPEEVRDPGVHQQ